MKLEQASEGNPLLAQEIARALLDSDESIAAGAPLPVPLAAQGLTNRAVAERLFVSPKTVEANLSRAYSKLGIRSRAELGRLMAPETASDEGGLTGRS